MLHALSSRPRGMIRVTAGVRVSDCETGLRPTLACPDVHDDIMSTILANRYYTKYQQLPCTEHSWP